MISDQFTEEYKLFKNNQTTEVLLSGLTTRGQLVIDIIIIIRVITL